MTSVAGNPNIDSSRLLTAWETGLSRPELERCLVLLQACWPGVSEKEWASCAIGVRDHFLMVVREQKFGDVIEACAQCPQCSERLDVRFALRDVLLPASPGLPEELEVKLRGYEVTFRLPTSADLIATSHLCLAGDETPLLTKCVSGVRRNGRAVTAADLPKSVREAIGRAMAKADPQADIQIAVACTSCGHGWSLPFDIASYLWGELDEWAQRMLGAVHLLATAYGWTEQQVLGLSDQRRRLYLEMVEA